MGWYDLFSRFYDGSVEGIYLPFRDAAVERLELTDGMRILDAGCGTGQSFDRLSVAVGETGRVVGFDASQGMLKRAAMRIETKGFTNVQLVHGSVLQLDRQAVSDQLGDAAGFDRALSFLLLSALEQWPDAFARIWSLVKPGGKMVIVDAHTDQLGVQGRLVNLTARADIRRRVWSEMEQVATGFVFERLDAPRSVGGDIIIASGFKPT